MQFMPPHQSVQRVRSSLDPAHQLFIAAAGLIMEMTKPQSSFWRAASSNIWDLGAVLGVWELCWGCLGAGAHDFAKPLKEAL